MRFRRFTCNLTRDHTVPAWTLGKNPGMQNKTLVAAVAAGISLTLALSSCSTDVPEVQAAPTDETTSAPPEDTAPSETEAAKAAPGGSRNNPLKKGQARQISEESAFTISFGKTEPHGECLAVPITAEVDWENLEKQAKDNGDDTTDVSSIPFFSVTTAFVTDGGKTYDASTGDGCMDAYVEFGDKANTAVEIYPPTKQATAIHLVQVPEAERAGGVWVVQNSVGDKVFGVS